MNLQLQIYIDTSGSPLEVTPKYERIDLFDFESIELTSTIQDAQDIGEVFTDFSQTFKVPASKRNNKVFTHFYQSSLDNGFDSRIKQRAKLELGGIPFRNGFISLTESLFKNGKAESYSITFYGAIVSLKQIIGDDELKSLSGLSIFNHEYNLDNVWNGFETGLALDSNGDLVTSTDRDIVYPSISFNNDWYYSSTEPIGEQQEFNQGFSKNLRTDDTSDDFGDVGIKFTELKPAIKVKRIIEAIEETYSTIQFSDDFFNTSEFNELYLLLNKNKGDVQNLNNQLNENLVDKFVPEAFDSATFTQMIDNSTVVLSGEQTSYLSMQLSLDTISTEDYNVIIFNDGNEIYRESHNGNVTINVFPTSSPNTGRYTVYISAISAISFTEIEWNILYEVGSFNRPDINQKRYSTESSSDFTNTFTFNIPRQVPRLKVLDLLRGLFKMYNLTAYYEDGVIVVDTLDNYYAGGSLIDLTRYLDNGEMNIKRSKLYSDIDFSFSDPKTFGVINQNEQTQDDFGDLKYQTLADGKNRSLVFDGTKYKIQLPFEKGFFERLNDEGEATFTITDFSNGWIVDKDQSQTDIAPMLFYNVPTTVDSTVWKIGFIDKLNYVTQFNRASNSNEAFTRSIHFGSEIDEYTGNINQNSLFALGYQKYITNLFSKNTRIMSAEFYLNLNTLVQYKLNDKIKIKGDFYRINSIKSNLNTGKSTLELITSYD